MKQVILVYRGRPVAFIIMDDDVELRVVGGVGVGVEAQSEPRETSPVQQAAREPAPRESGPAGLGDLHHPAAAEEPAGGETQAREEPELRFDEEVSEAENVTEGGGGEGGGGERGAEAALRRLIQGV